MPGDVSICLVAGGLEIANIRLQPWRYLLGVGHSLKSRGYAVTLVSDGSREPRRESLAGLPLVRLPGVRTFSRGRASFLAGTLKELGPEVIVLHLGLTSFLHQDFPLWQEWPTVGIFTSPIYNLNQLSRLGWVRIWRERSLVSMHLLGALVPRKLLREQMRNSGLRTLVVQTQTTRQQLLEGSLWPGRIEVIPPGVERAWSNCRPEEAARKRKELGYEPDDEVVAYFGSPAALRGLPLLIRAINKARCERPALKLLALVRKRAGLPGQEPAWRRYSWSKNGSSDYIRWVDEYLSVTELVQCVAACDLVALPFELVPSDAPLSLLEAQALGKPLVTTRAACLPELVAGGAHYLVEPGDSDALASALLQAVSELSCRKLVTAPMVRSWQTVGRDWARLLEGL